MHFNGVVRNLVFLMLACAQQLNDPTAAPSRICCTFHRLGFTRWRLNIYNISIHTMRSSELNTWKTFDLVFVWWNWFSISETQSAGIWHVSDYQLKIGWKCINVMSLEGAEGVYLSVNCDAFEDFVRTTKFDASQWKSLLLARQPTLATLIHLLTCTTSHLALVRENVNVGCVYVLQYDWWGMLSTRLFILAYG